MLPVRAVIRALKQTALTLCLLTGSAMAQTPALIANGPSNSTGSNSVTLGAAGANAILVFEGRNAGTPTDSAGDTFQLLHYFQGFDTYIHVWAAMGVTGVNGETVTTDGAGDAYLVMAWSNLASFDKYGWTGYIGNTGSGTYPTLTLTPTNTNEVAIVVHDGTFNAPPAVSITGLGWTQLDTTPASLPSNTFADGYSILTTTAATTVSASDNSFNGADNALLLFTTTASPLPLAVSPSSLPPGMRTAVYPQTATNLNGPYPPTCFTPSGGAAPYTITSIGSPLPAGLSFDGLCIAGTPTATGTVTGIKYHVVDHLGATVDTPSMSLTINPLTTTVDLQGPRYGFVVFPGAQRHPGVVETNPGTTGLINWSLSDNTKATISCTTNCAGTVTVTPTGAAGTCSIAGTVGNYSIAGGNDVTLTATSVDANEDSSHSHDSETYHICKGDHLVDLQPAYNQAFFGQQKHFYSYVLGQIPQDVTWSCIAPDNSSCAAALDIDLPSGSGGGSKLHNRDVTFTAPSTVGSYKLIVSSVSAYDGTTTATNYAWVYVGGALTSAHTGTTALPVSPDGTEVQACFADPRFTTSWSIKKDGTGDFTHLWGPPTDLAVNQNSGGYIMRVFNQDLTGSAPTQYPDFFYINRGGTRDLPTVVCGVPDAAGHLPIQQRQSITASGRDEVFYGPTFQGNMITIGPVIGSPLGYDASSGTDFVNVWGLFQLDSSHAADARGVEAAPGIRHLAMEGMKTDYMMDGALLNNNTTNSGTHHSEFNSAIGGNYQHCGDISTGNHCLYMQANYTLITSNLFRDNLGGGLANKIRGGGDIIAFNSYVGTFGYPTISFEASTDDSAYASVEINLGAIGDTDCGNSAYCWVMSHGGDENWLHIAANEQSLAEAYVEGNILSQATGALYAVIFYGAQTIGGCNANGTSCTNGEDHVGGLHLWNNTLDRDGGALVRSDDTNYNANYDHTPVRSYPWLWHQNNSYWNAGVAPDGSTPPPFQIDMSPYFQGGFKNNLIATGSVDLSSPIIPGHTGWSTDLGGEGGGGPLPPWTAYSPKDSYLSGVNTFVVTPTIPYDTTTFKPITGSPLNGAGAPIVDPLMSILPVRYEADPVGGFVIPRTDSGITIGARASSAPITVAGTPSFTPDAGTFSSAQSVTIASSTSGATICYTSDGSAPTANGGGTCTHGTTYSSAVLVASSETLKALASKSGLTDSPVASAAYVISTTLSATPTFSPIAGSYTSAQSVTISSSTSGATICYTVDGSTPTANGVGTCTHGSTYSSPVAVAASLTIKAMASKSGNTDSAVASAAYVITIPTTATPTCAPPAGTYSSVQSVTCTSTTPASTTYCTVDGSAPTTASPNCSAISVASTRTLKAISAASGYFNSAVLSALYTINIPVPPTITTSSLADGMVGSVYSVTLAASGGTGPYTWAIWSGALPAGLSLSSGGVISGTPTTAGTSNVAFKVTDSLSATANSPSMALVVNPPVPPTVTTTTLPAGIVGSAYSATLTANAGRTPYTWAVASGTLPAGLSLSSGGVISGTPTTTGSSTLTFRVTDALSATSVSSPLTLLINSPAVPLSITTTTLPTGTSGVAYTVTLAATGGSTPYVWSVLAGTLPSGLQLDSATGVLLGTPAVPGVYTGLVFRVADSASHVATSGALAITVAAPIPPACCGVASIGIIETIGHVNFF